MVICQKFHRKRKKIQSLAVVKFFSRLYMLVDFKYFFCINHLALKFGTHIKMISCQTFHSQFFSPREAVKVDRCEISFLRMQKCHFEWYSIVQRYKRQCAKIWKRIETLTLKRRVGHRGNHLFCDRVNCLIKIMQKHSLEVKLLSNDLPFTYN